MSVFNKCTKGENMKSYLIKDTTKERKRRISKKKSFYLLHPAGDALPSDDAIKIVKQYIEGEKS